MYFKLLIDIWVKYFMGFHSHVDGLEQSCGISIANALDAQY